MKSMKKMLCLLLVAMLLVAAIPVAAGAQEIPSFEQAAEEPVAQQPAARTVTTLAEPDVPSDVGQAEVNYTVLFAVENPEYAGTPKYALSTAIAVFSVASDANADTIRAAAAGAVAKAGYSSVTADSIVSRVSANGGAALVHNVRYGSIRTDAQSDGAGNKFIYTLSVSARPEEVNADETVQAKILLDKENTGKFEDTGKTVPVTLVKTTYGTTVTYSMKSNGGATVDDIKGVLGANYKNKTLSMTVQGPSADGKVTYRVVVKGNSGSTGTNIPTYDGTGSNNNGGNNIGSGSTGSNIPGYNPGSGSSNNGGSTNNGGTGTVAQFKVTFLNVNGVEFYSEYVAANGTIAASADFLNSSVGTKAGYEHIGWKANSGSTKTTNVVLTDKINANVTYAPVFKSLADNRVVIPGGGSSTTSNGNSSSSGTTTNKFPYPVYLNIYKDTLVGSPDKRVEITNGIALDGLVSLEEAKTVVKNYYTAKDSDGISYDGLYIAEGNWVADYVADTAKYNSIDAGSMRQTGTVYINVMIGNAKAKTSATADSSNPKTGDTIFVPFMVMGLTATALAAAYVFGKKRIAR